MSMSQEDPKDGSAQDAEDPKNVPGAQSPEPGKPSATPPQSEDTEDVDEDTEEFDEERAKALIVKLRNQTKELKKRAKIADALEAQEQKRRDAELSETERLQQQLEAAQTKLSDLELQRNRREAAAKFNIPDAFIPRLQGSTLEELMADAKELAKVIPSEDDQPQKKSGSKPKIPPSNPPASQEETKHPFADVFSDAVLFDPKTAEEWGGGVIWSPTTQSRMKE